MSDDLRKELENAFDGVNETEETTPPEATAEEKPEEAPETSEPVETPEAKPVVEVEPAPQSWGANVKGKWGELPNEVRSEILKREQDIHKMLTSHDGDLRMGREMKDVISPYIPHIQAAGSTPAQTVSSLLNTVYRLQTGDQQTRAAIVAQIAQDYGVELDALQSQNEYVDPTIAQLQQEIQQLKQQANPQVIQNQLQQQLESVKVQEQVRAFASDPANVYYEQVKPIMATLLGNGQAADLKEAYEMACYANPQIRSSLELAKKAEADAKRKAEITAKKHAAASISGSPAVSNPTTQKSTNKSNSIADDIRAAMDELENRA